MNRSFNDHGATVNRTIDSGSVFRALKPAAIDTLARDGYARRRDADLAQALAAQNGPLREETIVHRATRRPRLLIAGLATVCVAAAGVAVTVTGERDTGQPPARVVSQTGDAHTFLLASAQVAGRAPTTTGRYWYIRQRTWEPVEPITLPKYSGAKLKAKLAPGKKAVKMPPPGTYVAHSEDSWSPRDPGDPTRTIVNLDVKFTFSSASAEEKWKAMGSPTLWFGKTSTQNYNMAFYYQVGNTRVTAKQLLALPTDQRGLQGWLKSVYDRETAAQWGGSKPDFASYLWDTARDLLVAPLTPGTRAALYRVLAGQSKIRMVGKVIDPLGRAGVALGLVAQIGPPFFDRMIIDPATGRLLADEQYRLDASGAPAKTPAQWTVYQAAGWVDQLGARP